VEHPIRIKSYDTRFLRLKKNANISVYPADLTKPHFFKDADTFDFISFCDVMEHLVPADLPGVFAQLLTLLKPNGYVLLNTPNIASLL